MTRSGFPDLDSRQARIGTARGVNWFPTWSRNSVDYWTTAMPRDQATRELVLAGRLGFDHVRIWLSAHGWARDPNTYRGNLVYVFDVAQSLGLGVVVELFDSCGVEHHHSDERITIEEVRRRAAGSRGIALIEMLERQRSGDVFGAGAIVDVAWNDDPMVAVWEGFVPNPGYDALDVGRWPEWDAYTRDIVNALAMHPALVLIEVMNEPFMTQLGQQVDREPIVAFIAHVIDVVRDLTADVPLAIGADQGNVETYYAGVDLDVVSVHSLAGVQALRRALIAANELAAGRPVYLSEWGMFPGARDEIQRDEIDVLLAELDQWRVGWAITHLIAGYGPFANTALLYPSGAMRPAASLMRSRLAGSVPDRTT